MLPVQTTARNAAVWVLAHTTAAALAALALATRPSLGWLYLGPVGLATAALLVLSSRLVIAPSKRRALAVFHGSNLYLALVMLTICLDTAML
jgi:heme O synthase-like polyprenyltransferase